MAIALVVASCIRSAAHSARSSSDFNVGELHAREMEEGVSVFGETSLPVRVCVRIPGLLLTSFGIFLIYLMLSIFPRFQLNEVKGVILFRTNVINFLCCKTSLFFKINLENQKLVCSLIMYVRTAFQSFEDEFRSIKEVVFAICREFTEEGKCTGFFLHISIFSKINTLLNIEFPFELVRVFSYFTVVKI